MKLTWLACLATVGAAYDSCYHEEEKVHYRHGAIEYLRGHPGYKGAIYRVCQDGVYHCKVSDQILDQPSLPSVDCDQALAEYDIMHDPDVDMGRRLGLMVKPPAAELWPAGVVCYALSDKADPAIKPYLEATVTEYRTKTPIRVITVEQCLALRMPTLCGNCKNFALVEDSKPGCFAFVGYEGKPNQVINLHPDCYLNQPPGHVQHEFGHAIGLFHEHAHPKRKIIIVEEALKASRNNYVKKTDTKLTAYDMGSVMHYGASGGVCVPTDLTVQFCDIDESREKTGCVVPTLDDCDDKASLVLGQRDGLSPTDVESIQVLYKAISSKEAKAIDRLLFHATQADQADATTSSDDDDDDDDDNDDDDNDDDDNDDDNDAM
ncbi:hypothetical protein AaE_000291 [Aphanomyces astaci]|uniref:Metalloendopeptidase n=2 Tax=Aphanomyces astaci TaxID=112090 RepID=A0A397BQX6_APHAT|nr:hypothetical protein AaE_000291 [Aphanomyces astaci]RHY24325.1 hypothetical protein DYB36_012588 [Aphanomyces astaci]